MSARFVVRPDSLDSGWLHVVDTQQRIAEAQFAPRHRDLAYEMAARLNVRELTAQADRAEALGFRRLEMTNAVPGKHQPAHGAAKTREAALDDLPPCLGTLTADGRARLAQPLPRRTRGQVNKGYLVDLDTWLHDASALDAADHEAKTFADKHEDRGGYLGFIDDTDAVPIKLSEGAAVVPDSVIARYGREFLGSLGGIPAERVFSVSETAEVYLAQFPVGSRVRALPGTGSTKTLDGTVVLPTDEQRVPLPGPLVYFRPDDSWHGTIRWAPLSRVEPLPAAHEFDFVVTRPDENKGFGSCSCGWSAQGEAHDIPITESDAEIKFNDHLPQEQQ